MSTTNESTDASTVLLHNKRQSYRTMAAYTPATVIRALRLLLTIESYLDGGIKQLPETVYLKKKTKNQKEQPFGGERATWPLMQPKHAREPIDGKERARQQEELMVMYIDMIHALERIHEHDRELLFKYHVLQTHTLDDLVVERGLSSRGSMQQRVHRAVMRLVRELEKPK